jgi:PAS domain S-box-containing protein
MSASGVSPLSLPEKYLSLLLEAAPDAMLVASADGKIQQVNQLLEQMFGYRREELVGRKVELLTPRRFRTAYRQRRQNYFVHPGVCPMGQMKDFVGQRKDGAEFPADISVNPVKTEKGTLAILAIRDVSEQKQMETALRQSEERFRIALTHLPVVVFHQNRALRYSWIYSSIPAWLGQEYIGHSDAEIFEPKEASRLTTIKRKILRTGVGAHDEASVVFLGSQHFLDVTIEPLRNRRHGIIGLTGVYFDITPLKRYILERERLAADLKAALDQVKLLKGLISICACCKRVFNEEGAWQQVESYIQAHSEAQFTHSICPDCMRRYYPDYCRR